MPVLPQPQALPIPSSMQSLPGHAASPPAPPPQVARTLSERISQFAVVTLDSCAYAGTGNVLKVGVRGSVC